MALKKSSLAKELEQVLNQDLPSDLHEASKIKKKNKKEHQTLIHLYKTN